MNTKRVLAAAAALMMIVTTGCSSADSSSDTPASKADTSSAAESKADTSENSSEPGDTSEPDEPAAADNAKIEELSARIDELTEQLETLKSKFDDYYETEFHDIYDDTAVIEAYKNKDDSSLTDDKDKLIYKNMVQAIDENIEEGMTDFEKEKAIYDYIFRSCHYNWSNLNPIVDDEEDWSHTPYGFFTTHSVICVGYATTFKLFMDALGINCEIIHSTEQGEHAWNIVEIDGDWYHVDCFFDGGEVSPLYGLFNVTDEIKQETGYPWNPADFHICDSLKYNVVCMNAVECEDIYDLPKLLKDAIDNNDGKLYMKIKPPKGTDLEEYSSLISNVCYSIQADNKIVSCRTMSDKDTGYVYLCLGVEEQPEDPENPYDPEDPEEPLSPIDFSQLSDSFYDTFGGEITFNYYDEDYDEEFSVTNNMGTIGSFYGDAADEID